jgi:GH24 family phage-related lysozyme (muramidase)
MAVSNEGLELIRQLEGCRLVAYPDPGSGGEPWTVGYGHTGPEVTPGLVISEGQAEAWLLVDVAEAERSVDQLLAGVGLNGWQREALVSFCFNVGAGALETSTLRRRLLAGEAAQVVLPEELPRWVKSTGGLPLAGLIRRRQLELAHSRRGSAAIELTVPYYAQNDSSTGQGPRMCFSSSCAMAAEFLRPGCLSGAAGQPDDRYLAIVQRHGDTTDAQAQIQALAELGITARLRTDGRIEDLIAHLLWRPLECGGRLGSAAAGAADP